MLAKRFRRNQSVSEDQIFEHFKTCAVEVLAVDADKITREACFALDADSLDLVELERCTPLPS